MTIPQIASLALLAVGVLYVYGRPLAGQLFAVREPELMDHVRSVVTIRDQYRNPDVTAACNALLQAMLGVKP